MKWEVGLSTGIAYAHPIEAVIPYIAQAGFRVIEVATAPAHFRYADPVAVAATRAQLDRHGLRVHSLHAPFGQDLNFTAPDAALRRYTLERMREAAEALRALGGRDLVVHPGGEDQRWVWEREARLRLSVEGLTQIWADCRSRGLVLIVETPLPHLLGGQVEDLAWIMDRLPAVDVGVCLDTSHASLGGSLFDTLERFGPRLLHVQASDNRGHTDDHLVPGDGIIDWARVLSVLERVGYDGLFMLEVAGDGDIEQHVRGAARLLGGPGPLPPGWPPSGRSHECPRA
jgi:sugar phosphate isomerase/epimerase